MQAVPVSLTRAIPAGDPSECDEFGYRTGTPEGILVLRYVPAGRLTFGLSREDLLHQLYWAPDNVVTVTDGADVVHVGGSEAWWVRRAVTHQVNALGSRPVYRICLRERPPALSTHPLGVVRLSEDAAGAVLALCRERVSDAEAMDLRSALLEGIRPEGVLDAGSGPAAVVARHLRHTPADPAGLEDWARRLHVSPKTLQRDFHRSFDMSFRSWRTQMRLELARRLVESLPVTDVAREVGYHSSSAFIAAYRREFGRTPTQDQQSPTRSIATA